MATDVSGTVYSGFGFGGGGGGVCLCVDVCIKSSLQMDLVSCVHLTTVYILSIIHQ